MATEHEISELPLPDRVRLLSGKGFWRTEDLPEWGVPSVLLTDGPHGLRKEREGDGGGGLPGSIPATCFPPAVTLASSWDPELLAEVGAAVGAEAVREGVSVVLGPGLNIKRHPFCGRNFEYLSEDPLLAGRLAAAIARGIQSQGVGACLKHFAANNQESHRLVVDVVVDERTLREIYLTGFEIAVKEAAPETIMAAYNKVNGHYACEHPHLLRDILRDEWGFAGLVMSDWAATNNRVAGVAVGLDLEMPGNDGVSDDEVIAAVRSGALAEQALNDSARRVVEFARRPRPEPVEVDFGAHHCLARRAAAQATVLLANDGILPLPPQARVAVIGAFAERPRFQGGGSSLVNPTQVDTALAAFRDRGQVSYAPGYDPHTSAPDKQAIAEAVAVARGADVAVVLVGLPPAYESEGFDRGHLDLPEQHNRLVEAVASANPRTVVALSNGSPVAMPWADRVAAIVESYLGGQASGSALVDVLYGDEEPSGRLAESFPFSSADVAADLYFPGEPRQVQYREGLYVGYRYYDTAEVPVRFPFGHGLSYTTFEYGAVEADADEVSVTLTNTGDRAGAEVVQVYVAARAGEMPRPRQELRGFRKVRLLPGESQRVVVPLGDRAFSYWDAECGSWQTEPGEYEVRVGSSSGDIRATAGVRIQSGHRTHPPRFTGLVAATEEEFADLLGRPVPPIDPARPFTRNSTVGELRGSRAGRLVRRLLLRRAAPLLESMAGGDPDMVARLTASVDEAPLRQTVLMSAGSLNWSMLDALLAWLNGRPTEAVRAARTAVRPPDLAARARTALRG